MIATAHIAAGAVAGLVSEKVPTSTLWKVVLALIIGFFSHFLLDMIPHSDYEPLEKTFASRVALIEAAVATGAAILMVRRKFPHTFPLSVLAGIGASALPDSKSVVWMVFPPESAAAIARVGYQMHDGIHARAPFSLLAGWGAELGISVLLFAVILSVPRRT